MVYSSLIGCMPRGPLPVWYHAGDTASLAGFFHKILPSLTARTAGKKRLLAAILTQYWAKSAFLGVVVYCAKRFVFLEITE